MGSGGMSEGARLRVWSGVGIVGLLASVGVIVSEAFFARGLPSIPHGQTIEVYKKILEGNYNWEPQPDGMLADTEQAERMPLTDVARAPAAADVIFAAGPEAPVDLERSLEDLMDEPGFLSDPAPEGIADVTAAVSDFEELFGCDAELPVPVSESAGPVAKFGLRIEPPTVDEIVIAKQVLLERRWGVFTLSEKRQAPSGRCK